ncbi:hypothetical protein [Allorhodopirellula solitaria]|uniref:4Fe-4S ferredoxin-type domain-containing protein n=1 Tax=Allorhodopirellula solitaria TaxID=2527987 RepID=A0A5C5XVW8_9BACT|nr:hypothetical protein [Allorhodopirellula solitaria]TWT67050.1 hypothetical protein CA85_18960 [Allorhodopirellula solitaria]
MFIPITLQRVLVIAAAVLLATPGPAVAGSGKLLDQTGCVCCPVCDHVCKLDAKQVDEERSGFEVESKVICIPRVVFPWQVGHKPAWSSCEDCDGQGCTTCSHNGARLRRVCVLKSEKYKCPVCQYSWSAEKNVPRGCGADCCDQNGCCEFDATPDSPAGTTLPAPAPWNSANTIRTAKRSLGFSDYYQQPDSSSKR